MDPGPSASLNLASVAPNPKPGMVDNPGLEHDGNRAKADNGSLVPRYPTVCYWRHWHQKEASPGGVEQTPKGVVDPVPALVRPDPGLG